MRSACVPATTPIDLQETARTKTNKICIPTDGVVDVCCSVGGTAYVFTTSLSTIYKCHIKSVHSVHHTHPHQLDNCMRHSQLHGVLQDCMRLVSR